MHFITLPTLGLLALSQFSLNVVANSGYAATCNSLGIGPPLGNDHYWTINADCRQPDGEYTVGTLININSCFGNGNGILYPQLNGGFTGSCKDIGLSGTILSAKCRNDAGNYDSASIDTDSYIGNGNGLLYCFDQSGF